MRLTFFVVSTPGLETITLAEVCALGYSRAKLEEGGVLVSGTVRDLYRCNYLLRTATRIYLRLFSGSTYRFTDVTAAFQKIELAPFVDPSTPLHVSASSHASTLYHTGAIEDAARDGITAQGFTVVEKKVGGSAPISISLRIVRDRCTISIDTSGDPLHQRGYKSEVGPAPLRETLAAALLRAIEWNPSIPLCDPFCGSGTIPIEAALIAQRIPAGAGRSFGFQQWPGLNRGAWTSVVAEAEAVRRQDEDQSSSIEGSDIDSSVVEYASRNAERAGVEKRVTFSVRDARDVRPSVGSLIITNPPFGDRLQNRSSVKRLLSRFAEVAQKRGSGAPFAILVPSDNSSVFPGIPTEKKLSFLHGGKRVVLLTGVF